MEKSIENIWNKGFLNSDELKAPRINDLYNKKSALLLEKLKKTYTIDNNSLIPITILLAIVLSYFQHYLAAIYTTAVILSLFFFNKNILNSLESIKITTNSFDYLVTYRNKIRKIIKNTTKLIGIFFPILIIPVYYLIFKNIPMFLKLAEKTNTTQTICLLIIFSIILGIIGIIIYRLTTKLVYGSYLKKLDEIISDMEELRN